MGDTLVNVLFSSGSIFGASKYQNGKKKSGILFCVTYQTVQINTGTTKSKPRNERQKVREPLINNQIFSLFIHCFIDRLFSLWPKRTQSSKKY